MSGFASKHFCGRTRRVCGSVIIPTAASILSIVGSAPVSLMVQVVVVVNPMFVGLLVLREKLEVRIEGFLD